MRGMSPVITILLFMLRNVHVLYVNPSYFVKLHISVCVRVILYKGRYSFDSCHPFPSPPTTGRRSTIPSSFGYPSRTIYDWLHGICITTTHHDKIVRATCDLKRQASLLTWSSIVIQRFDSSLFDHCCHSLSFPLPWRGAPR
jgi:hypothetical protein